MLVRYRHYTHRRITSVKNKLRHILAVYNADVRNLFTGRERLAALAEREARTVLESIPNVGRCREMRASLEPSPLPQ